MTQLSLPRQHVAPPDAAARPRGTCAPQGCRPPGLTPPLFRDGGLDQTLRQFDAVLEPRKALVGAPSGDGWRRCEDLATPEMVDGALLRLQAVQGGRLEVAASFYLGWYAASVAGPAVASFAVARRVPSLRASQLSLHLVEDGWFDVTALSDAGLAVLPDDPLAPQIAPTHAIPRPQTETVPTPGDPRGPQLPPAAGTSAHTGMDRPLAQLPAASVVVVDDVAALRAHLATEVVSHLEPLVRSLRARVRLGLPALWGAVSAQCARAFLLTERITGDPFAGRTEADAFFAAASPPLRARPTWHEFTHRDRHHVGMRRGSCCLAHELTSSYCTTCPFTTRDERESRLREWIDAQGYGGIAV